jgi:hypothetical protein
MSYFFGSNCVLCGTIISEGDMCDKCIIIKKVISLYGSNKVSDSVHKSFVIKTKELKDDETYLKKKDDKTDIEDTKPNVRIHTRSISNKT